MTATCTPGLPRVVSALVSSISLPAFAPDRIWIAATLPVATACEVDIGSEVDLGSEVDIGCEALTCIVWCDVAPVGTVCDVAKGLAVGCGCVVLRAGEGWEPPIVGTVCEVPGFEIGPSAFGVAPGRSTMVFSKSSGEAAFAPWSLMYFSLYLPSSTTSFDCRKCFLIGWPFTSVPLVEPRSSRNESLRIVTITACSPDTARLSIWMSLCGLRPMVVRSFVSVISFSTNPSILRISFAAMAVSFVYRNQLKNRESQPVGAA